MCDDDNNDFRVVQNFYGPVRNIAAGTIKGFPDLDALTPSALLGGFVQAVAAARMPDDERRALIENLNALKNNPHIDDIDLNDFREGIRRLLRGGNEG